MNDKHKYSVVVNGVTESDRIILKLIFAASQKIPGRNWCFHMEGDSPERAEESADIEICITESISGSDDIDPFQSTRVCLADRVADESIPLNMNMLYRPLMATRTLSLLDSIIEEKTASYPATDNSFEEIVPNVLAEDSEGPVCNDLESLLNKDEAIGLEEVLLEEPIDDIDFSISEEEASELAIVADNSLSNPANNDIAKEIEKADQDCNEEENITSSNTASQPTLKVLHSNNPINEETKSGDTSLDKNLTLPRVLVVDDSPSVRKQLELELALFNAQVDYAGDACVANDLLENNTYDVTFLDVVLPDGDGFQICKQVKSINKNTSVIMLTGKATPADKIKGTLAGCDAYLVKPVGRDVFQGTVKNYLTMVKPLNVVVA